MNQIKLNNFDRDKPFYPIIINYQTQLLAHREMLLWGLLDELSSEDIINLCVNKYKDIDENEKKTWSEELISLRKPLSLRSEYSNSFIDVSFHDISDEITGHFTYLSDFILKAAGFVFVLAHEMCKGHGYHDKGPLWEFLRHCRNAVAHGGNFNFKGSEPLYPAIFGNIILDKSLHGKPIFKDKNKIGLLSPGDPICLLW